MGRKKQKVRWTSVEEGFFTNENEDLEVNILWIFGFNIRKVFNGIEINHRPSIV